MYLLQAKDLKLKLDVKIFEDDLGHPTNTVVTIELSSFGFSCCAEMDVTVEGLAVFAKDLSNIYNSLEGAAKLKEPYGYESYIEFYALKRGHIRISGKLHAQPECLPHSISFENFIDQTELEDLAKRLYGDLEKYL